MEKRKQIFYWIATLWLALGMLSTGIVQLMKLPKDVNQITSLGYPIYLLTLLGIWKILGVIAILVPKFPIVKEWAYAGFFFAMTGAIFSHGVSGHPLKEIFPSLLLLILTGLSWYWRPVNRKIVIVNP